MGRCVIDLDYLHNAGEYKGRTYKGGDDLALAAEKVVDLLRSEQLPIWQAKDVLKRASELLDWETLK